MSRDRKDSTPRQGPSKLEKLWADAKALAAEELRRTCGRSHEEPRYLQSSDIAPVTFSVRDGQVTHTHHERDPHEAEVRAAIETLSRAASMLKAAAESKGAGRLAVWARRNAARVSKNVRDMDVPWIFPPVDPTTIVAALVLELDVDKRDPLCVGRVMTDKEVGCLAVLRGYKLESRTATASELYPEDVIAAARKAVHSERLKRGTRDT